jgi:hypothetical protein
MSIAELRQQLHKYIDSASEHDIQEVFSFVEDHNGVRYTYSEEELKELYERRKKFLDEGSKGYTVEEAHKLIRQRKQGS